MYTYIGGASPNHFFKIEGSIFIEIVIFASYKYVVKGARMILYMVYIPIGVYMYISKTICTL